MAELSRNGLQVDTYDMLDSYPASYKPKGSIRRPIIKAVDEETDDEEGPRVRSTGCAAALSIALDAAQLAAVRRRRAAQLGCGMRSCLSSHTKSVLWPLDPGQVAGRCSSCPWAVLAALPHEASLQCGTERNVCS